MFCLRFAGLWGIKSGKHLCSEYLVCKKTYTMLQDRREVLSVIGAIEIAKNYAPSDFGTKLELLVEEWGEKEVHITFDKNNHCLLCLFKKKSLSFISKVTKPSTVKRRLFPPFLAST